MHYCMNKFAGWSLLSAKKDKCSKCGMTGSKCCKDESKQIKITLDQQKTDYAFLNPLLPLHIISVYNVYTSVQITKLENTNLVINHGPPLIPKQGFFAFYSIFII